MEFSKLKLNDQLLKALEREKYVNPTPIQEQAIPPLLKGRDLMGIAQTGTGKTAAFILPILHRLESHHKIVQNKSARALILAPTRELAAQIWKSCKNYGKYMGTTNAVIYGGVGQNPQVKAMSHGVDVLIATPGRLLDLINQRHISLDSVEYFVLDEADRMLDMGFINDIKKIIALIPKNRQTLCFSATMSKDVEKLVFGLLNDPVEVKVSPESTTVEKIEQRVLFIDQEKKNDALIRILNEEDLKKVLLFTRTKIRANKVSDFLNKKGVDSDAIHGNKSQNQRTRALKNFQKGSLRVLAATDIAARGIDVEGISHVINYDLPNEPEVYVHRIGRTARAGAEGIAYTLCSADERGYLEDIEKLIKQKIRVIEHPDHSQEAQDSRGAISRSAHVKRGRMQRKGPPRNRSRAGPRRGNGRGSSFRKKGPKKDGAGSRPRKFNRNRDRK